ncbi:uncharacterized protein TNCV_4379332 [Trichonephila clavipes]|nr:uncharacterized protein TNCV_4379332 [Trichonephila clavipes]
MEQATGYPHRPPLLRLQSRRTSVSMDDVVRRTNSASSSPDANLLTVQGNLPGRRHSDNTIQPPRILVAPASPDGNLKRGSSAGMLPIRRHSGGQDNRFSNWTPRNLPSFIQCRQYGCDSHSQFQHRVFHSDASGWTPLFRCCRVRRICRGMRPRCKGPTQIRLLASCSKSEPECNNSSLENNRATTPNSDDLEPARHNFPQF